MDEKNLVVLAYGGDTTYVLSRFRDLESKAKKMSDVKPEDVRVDLKKGLWSFRDWEITSVGETIDGFGPTTKGWGVVGVYDHTRYKHVKNLVRAVEEIMDRRYFKN